jgi:hypothetical protein
MVARNDDIYIAIGDLRTGGTVAQRFLNILHEVSHRIVDGFAVKTFLRKLSRVVSEEKEMIHLVKEISVIYFNKAMVAKYNPEFVEQIECLYNLDRLIKVFVRRGGRYENKQNLQVFLSDLFENLFSCSLSHPQGFQL